MDPSLKGSFLLDNSAWARLGQGRLPAARNDEIAAAAESGRLIASLPFLIEAGYSARSAEEHAELVNELLALPWAALDEAVESRAVEAQRQLARSGHHRVPPVDLLMAALADRHGFGILHYDRDYDLIARRTDLVFKSEWLAEAGLLGAGPGG